jgi:deoxynucleoside triphosphate triphosphohydrolase SAMHD1
MTDQTQKARNLKRQLFVDHPQFKKNLEDAFDAVGFNESYFQQCCSSLSRKNTLIKDAVWGMMEFSPDEIALIDCPLMQRLRGIRQLGLSNLTYPSAEHTRFGHSLGVAHIVKRFLTQTELNEEMVFEQTVRGTATKINAQKCDANERKIVQHAALLHDIGHFPLSHVIEKVLHNYNGLFMFCDNYNVDDFLSLFEDSLGLNDPKMAECLSIAIILSDRFEEFYRKYVDNTAGESQLLKIALTVAGEPPDRAFPGLSSIISHSNVDADKIDYLSRDSLFCGIPVGIDVARLFFRSMFLDIDREQLKELSPAAFDKGVGSERHFIVNASGLDTVEEVVHSRAVMFQRVYKHKATRLAERLLEKGLVEAIYRGAFPAPHVTEIWATEETDLYSKIKNSEKNLDVSYSGWRVRKRFFPKRALIFGHSELQDIARPPIEGFTPDAAAILLKGAAGSAIEDLKSMNLFGPTLDALERELEDEATKLRDLLDNHGTENLPDGPCNISILPMEHIAGESKGQIILEGSQLKYHKSASRRDQQVDGDEISGSVGYIFAEPKWREIVQVSARVALHKKHQKDDDPTPTELPHGAYYDENRNKGEEEKIFLSTGFNLDRNVVARRSGIDMERLETIEYNASNEGYFDETPKLRPYAKADSIGDNIVEKFKEFDGVVNWRVSKDHIRHFIEQFPPKLRDEAMKLVSEVVVIGRGQIRDEFPKLFKRIEADFDNPELRRAIAPFTPSSGTLVWNLLKQENSSQLKDSNWEFVESPSRTQGVLNEGGIVVFVDDNIASGVQARAQFHAFAGKAKDEVPLELRKEKNIFQETFICDLKNKGKMYLAVVVADELGMKNIKEDSLCMKLGVKPVSCLDLDNLLAEGNLNPSTQIILTPDMEEFLTDVGRSLLEQNKPEWDSKFVIQNALGYGGKRARLATKFNVPTATLTAFWMPGTYKKSPWLPLLIRRGYQNRLVV